ncbi:nicotinate-nucleotide--dimethylbenzimidazole phosphoribosyltransferase [Streptomyces sp. APSN-46.1]|uniref:nicotinate-nucleotide--dimethylbenzimidazole phosphoribosyltransferase n=1 Tax=Streptomyces sp. APSN-46.1 TaxID=2929049 RepID=UPI001FB2C01A|nr:nicotinate-nucleotide--dimethylbenzimidazole phosphoribosyltransferase [Streptomyces sp. APSN-46.1]MCJ1679546.1 nicotinate-nucleotide--dimethylbenzimidazole phosphoribosyltransferase [Streptomyces sp. APSN-46.1]
MTDTGQVPGEGLPDNAGMVDQQGIPAPVQAQVPHPMQVPTPSAPAGYAFQDLMDNPAEPEDEELLLMPSGQGAWSDPQLVPPVPSFPVATEYPEYTDAPPAPYAQYPGFPEQPFPEPSFPEPSFPEPAYSTGAHEAGGRDTGALDLGGLVVPPPAAPQAAPPVTPARRPLHMGPPVPEAGGVVRSLADRGPAAPMAPAAQPTPVPVRQPGPPTTGPEYLDIPRAETAVDPSAAPPQAGTPWAPDPVPPVPAPEAEAQAEPEPEQPVAAAAPLAAEAPAALAVTPEPEVAEPAEAAPEPELPAEAAVQPPAPQPAPVDPEVTTAQPAPEPAPAAPAAGDPAHAVPAAAEPAVPAAGEPALAVLAAGDPAHAVPAAVEPAVPAAGEPALAVPAAGDPAHAAVEPAVPAAGEPAFAVPAAGEPAFAVPAAGEPALAVPAAGEPAHAVPAAVEPAVPAAGEPAVPAAAAPADTEPAAGEPALAVPAAGEPAHAVPAAGEPALAVPAAGEPVHAAPAAAEPAHAVPAAGEPAHVAPAAGEPAHAVPAAGEPVPVLPAAGDPVPVPPAAGDPADTEPAAGEPVPTGPVPVAPAAGDPVPVPPAAGDPAPAYADAEREAVLRVMRERRDIRKGFRTDPIPHEVLLRVLEAAHTAPSVGHSQPWDFVVIRSAETRRTMHELAQRQREAYAKSLPKGRAKQFKELKIEAILDTPVNIVVTADPTRGGRHTLGRHTQPQMAPYSSALAVENLWLAARAEGLGVGWVSFFDEREMVRALGLPEHLEVVAYLCVGYVDEFPKEPELAQAGWSQRRPLAWVVHEETYGRRALPGEAPHDLLSETVASIRPLDAKALGEAWERQKRMTKPAGALGMLEIISAQLSGLSRVCPPPIPEPAAVAIFAGDHGVHAQGVTPWPQEVTQQMVANFLGGGAVCNAFANQVGAEVCVIDVGVAGDLPATPGLLPRKVRPGTADLSTGPAMTREEAIAAIEVGIETARDLVAAGNKALLTGEMGIANTTVSAALISVFTGVDPSEVTGRGTGINDETHARKVEVVRRALELHQPDPADPIGVLAAIGGLEHAAIVGLLLGGASLRTPVILDGVSAGAAALVARAIAPESLSACIAGHRSAEPGHVAALNKLGLRPLVDLDLRLGEGTGALLALPLVQSAARAMHEVATFDSAGVTEK